MRQQPRPRLIRWLGLLPLLGGLGLSAWSTPGRTTPSPAPGTAPVTARPAPPPLGMAPTTCPSNPPPTALPHGLGGAIGMSPVWVIGFTPGLRLHLGDPHLLWRDAHGWARKVAWVIGPPHPPRVTLQGWRLGTGVPLWFQIGGQAPRATPVLDPQHPGAVSPQQAAGWAVFPSYLILPRAGCYVLQASWPGGLWRLSFAAGR